MVVKGGVKVYRGAAAAARHYVEADHRRVDDYYLAEGTGIADRYVASPEHGVTHVGSFDGEAYETWVSGHDPLTGEARGRVRIDPAAVRFVEVVVNGPKSWSLAAALHPEVADAYDAAQDAAARQIIGWLSEHATTRVGPRGGQVQIPVEQLEAVVVRHYTSRAGDPHRHLHLQINARVFGEGKWRGLHTVGVRDMVDALNGIGHAAVMTDPGFRDALAAEGLTLDPATGEVRDLSPFVGRFSARARQIQTNVEAYETEWREAHPREEPGPSLRRTWDRRAWAQARPDKVIPRDGTELTDRWVRELYDLGYRDPEPTLLAHAYRRPGELDRDHVVATALARLGSRRSGWNTGDIRGEVERLIAERNIVTDASARLELAEDLTQRALTACLPLLDQPGVPEHIRALTSPEVIAVEADLVARLAARADGSGTAAIPGAVATASLDEAQQAAVAALTGDARLVVVEGAAGAGKTTTLAATRTALAELGHQLMVVTPTLKAAAVAAGQVGSRTSSAAWLAYQHGYRWDADATWTRAAHEPKPEAVLRPGDLLLVDEAGMLDQDTAHALLTIADEAGARVALVGDRHQLPAVGRGGVLDHAARWVTDDTHITLDSVHRFADPEYAALSLAMRTGTWSTNRDTHRGEPQGASGEAHQPESVEVFRHREPVGEAIGQRVGEVFDALWARDQIKLHPTETDRIQAIADAAATRLSTAGRAAGVLVMADTREQVAALNAAIRARLVTAGRVEDIHVVVTDAGERVGVGDRIATRRNDYDLAVANRDTWTVTGIDANGTLEIVGSHGTRTVPHSYVREHVEHAYATTVYGSQGETTSQAHLVLGEHTGAASAYVAMTRGRDNNAAHLVAESVEDARRQWIETFSRDRADLGPAHARELAATEAAKYAPSKTLREVRSELWDAWDRQADIKSTLAYRDRVRGHLNRLAALAARGEGFDIPGMPAVTQRLVENTERILELEREHSEIQRLITRLRHEPALATLGPRRFETERDSWKDERSRQAHQVRQAQEARARASSQYPSPVPTRSPARGPGIGF